MHVVLERDVVVVVELVAHPAPARQAREGQLAAAVSSLSSGSSTCTQLARGCAAPTSETLWRPLDACVSLPRPIPRSPSLSCALGRAACWAACTSRLP